MPEITEIQDFRRIFPNLLTAGQPMDDQFEAIRSAGVEVVINLANHKATDYNPDEKGIIESLGLQYIAIPVAWDNPLRSDLDQFFSAMQDHQGKTIFVHCARNMRVSSFVFLYRVVVLGQDPVRCRLDLDAIWQPNPVWTAFISASLSAP